MADIGPRDAAPRDDGPAGAASPSQTHLPEKAEVARLKKRRDFLRVAARQCKAVTPGLILQAAPTPPLSGRRGDSRQTVAADGPADRPSDRPPARPAIRVGFTVSKKVGNAVARNRARRRLRAAVDQLLAERALPGTDYVVIGRGATVDRPFDALLNDLRSAVQRVGASLKGGTKPAKKARDR